MSAVPQGFPITIEPGDVVVVNGDLAYVATARSALLGRERVKVSRASGMVSLDCPNACGAEGRDDGRGYSVRMGSRALDQWGAPLCPLCRSRLERREPV